MWCSKIICPKWKTKIQSQKWWKRMNRTKRPEPARVFGVIWGVSGDVCWHHLFWHCVPFIQSSKTIRRHVKHRNLPYSKLHEQLDEALSGFHICSFKAMRIYGLSEMDKVGLWNFYQVRIMVTTGPVTLSDWSWISWSSTAVENFIEKCHQKNSHSYYLDPLIFFSGIYCIIF